MDLSSAIEAAAPGSTVTVAPGRHHGPFVIDKPITLLGRGQAILDATGAGSVVTITTDGVVTLAGLTLVGGSTGRSGAGLHVATGTVRVLECLFRFNHAPTVGGGALAAHDGTVELVRCRLEANTGRSGGAILATGASKVSLAHSLVVQNAATFGGAAAVLDDAELLLLGCTVADNVAVGTEARASAVGLISSPWRAPKLMVVGSVLSPRRETPSVIDPLGEGVKVSVAHSLVPQSFPEIANGVGIVRGSPGFVMNEPEPYALGPQSPAVGAIEASLFGARTVDLLGALRARNGRADLGAFAFMPPRRGTLEY